MKDLFIGHSKSILDLTEEKKYINLAIFLTSVYMLYYEILNIVPDYVVFAKLVEFISKK